MINGYSNDLINTTGLNDVKAENVYTENLYINGELFSPDYAINGIITQSNTLSGTNQLQGTQFNGNITFTNKLNNISHTVFGYLGNVTSNIQNQLNSCVKTWTVGNTTTNTLAAGSNASVAITPNVASTTQNTKYDFTFDIPKGDKGTKETKVIRVIPVILVLKVLLDLMVLL